MIGCAKGPSYPANKGVRSSGKKPVVERENLRLTHLVGFKTPEVEALFQVGASQDLNTWLGSPLVLSHGKAIWKENMPI